MARIKKTSPKLDLSRYQTLVIDTKNNSEYFRLSEVPDTFTSGKNGFLIEGSTFLKPTTEIKIEVLDTEGNPLFVQPGEGIPEYYEGLSKLISIHVYEDTPIGIGKITILGEADTYIDENGLVKSVPDEWRGIYNVKWEKEIKINKNLLNETKVRFIKRPEIIVEELGESLFSKTISSATQTNGTIKGIAVTPALGTNLRNYAGGIIYHLKNESAPFQDGAKTISVSGTQIQTASVVEYINQYTLAVQVPHTTSQYIVGDFNGANYELNYEYASSVQESSLFGSFARFEINNLATFVGDVERVKLYGKSNAASADFNLIYDARINSQNLLETVISGSVIDRGFFTASYSDTRTWNTYWSTQSLSGTGQISLDTNDLYKSVKFRNYKVKTNIGNDIRLEKDSEYTLEFYVYYKTPSKEFLSNTNDRLKIYAASGLRQGNGFTPNYYFTTSLDTLIGDNKWRNPVKISYNFIPNVTDDWSINFEALNEDTISGDTFWQVGSVKIYGSNELGYSPDEFGFTIPIQRQLEQETFDFRLEYYDINNNFVPIQNTATQTFVSGNISLLGKSIDLSVDKLFFNYDGNESAVPSNQTINFFANKTKILGNLLITSQAFDSGGAYIPPATFGASPYPGKLTSIYETSNEFSASLTVSDFNGPLYSAPPGPGDLNVDRILYTITEGASTQPIIKRISVARIVAGSGSAGAPGAAGSDAKVVTLTSNIFTIPYDGNGNEIGTNDIYLTASQQNHSGTVYYEFLKNGVSKQNGTSQYYSVLAADEPTTASVDLWRVNTREGSVGGTIISFDTINLFGVKAGSDAYTVLLSNESHVLPVSNTGVVNYTGSGTDIQVYKGATELTGILSGTPISGQFSSSYIVTNGSVSVGQVSLSGNKIRFNSHSAMGTDNATIAYSVYLEGLATNFTKIQSLAKSFEGNDGVNGSSGSDARTVFLTSDKYVFYYNGDNIRTPLAQTASLTASAQTGSTSWGANIFYEFLKNSTSKVNSTSPYYIITGSEIPSASVRDLWQVNLRSGSASGPVLAFDNIDIFGLKDGGDAKTVDLTSPFYIISYDKNGLNPTPSALFKVTGSARNFAAPLFRFTGDVDSPEGTYTAGSSSNEDTASFTPPASYFTTPKSLRVGVSENSNPTVEVAFDTITIAAVRPGLDGVSGSSSTFYYIKPLTGTQIKNSQGTLEIQAVKISGSTSFNLNSGSVQLTTGSTAKSVLQTGNGVTAGSNGITFNAIFDSSAINGSRTIILKDTGSNEVYDTITLIDVTDGVSAGSGIADTLVFRRETNNTYTPSTASLTASFFSTNGTEYQERYKVYPYFNGVQDQMYATLETDSPYITASIDNGDGTKLGLGFANRSATKDLNFTFEFRDPQINETSSFTETMYIISDGLDGDDAYTVVLTNEAHSVPVSNDNPPVFDYVGSGTQIIAYRGSAQLNSTTGTPVSGTFSASYAVTTGTITVGSFDVSGFPIVIGDHNNLTTNTALITYTINLEGSASVSKVQTITRATEGDDGFSVFLTNDADTYPADENGNVAASSLAGIFTDVNVFKGTTQYNYNLAGGANAYKTGSIITSSNITISQSIVNNNVRITPQTATGLVSLTGSVTIPIITGSLTFNRKYSFSISKAGKSGSNALTILLNPTNQSVSKSKAGAYQAPVTFSIQVFETGSALRYTGSNNTLQNGYFTVYLPTGAGTLTNLTGSFTASIAPTLVTTDTGVSSSFAVQYRDSMGNLSSFISQSHYVGVVREGNDGINGTSGSDAFAIDLISNRYTFSYDQNGNLSPLTSQIASLTASAQTGSGARPWGANLFYQFQKNGTTVSPSNYSSPFWIVSESVGSSAIPAAGGIDVWQVNLLSGSGQTRVAFDNIDLFGLRSGSDAYTVFLTNEAHTFPADDQGNVSSPNLTVGATDVRFFRGISQYTHNQTGGTNTYKTGSIISSSNITISQSIVNNDVRITPASVSGLTQLSGSIIIPVTDNATNVTFTKTYTYSISKEGTDAYTVILTNEAHTLPTTNTGTVTYTNSGTSIVVYKADVELNSVSGTPTTGQFSVSAAVTTGTITVGAITVTGNPAVVADHSNMTTNLAVIEYTINIENLVSIKKYQSLAKSNQGDNGNNSVTILVTPETQVVSQSVYYNLFSSASKFDIFVYETGSALTYTTTQPPTDNSTFTVYAGNNGQTNLSVNNNKSGSIRPPHTTTGTGSLNQFSIQYKDSKGVVSQYISASHIVSVNRNGTTGPGIVFTGPWSSSRFYQYSDGANNGRRDVVISGSTNKYYATLQAHTAGGSNYPTDGASNAFWEYLGVEDYFVAAKLAIFEESYVRNTLNIGTNGSIDVEGSPAKANITIYGATTTPYIAIGQTVQGYNQKGIWLGNDAGNFKMSLTSGSTNFLTWDGSNLSIGGSITVTGGDAATKAYANNAADNSALTASNYSASLQTRIRTDSNGKLINAAGTTPSATGLYLGDDNLGYYNIGTGWRTYMNSSGDFYLGGTAGALTWTGGTLTVQGTINVTGGTASTKAYANDAASSVAKSASLADVVVNPSANVLIDSGKIYKIAGGANAEDTEVYSKVGYKNSAYVKIKPGANANNSFFGLDTTPSEAISSTNLDYAWYFFNNKSYIRRGATSIGEYPSGVNWAETDDFTIEYDGGLGKIRWFKNGTEQYSEDATKDLTYYFDSILYTSNTSSPILNYFEFGSGIPGSAYLSGSLTPRIRTDSSGRLINAAGSTPSTNGLYLGNDYLGYYFGGWKTYMDSSGQFFLSGTGANSLSWNGSTLDIVGTVKSSIVSASNFIGGTGDFSGDINASNIIANQGTIAGLTLNNSELVSSNTSMSIDAGDSALKIFSGSSEPVIAIRTGAPQSLNNATTSSAGDVPELSSSGIAGTRFYGSSGLNTNGTTTTWVIQPGNEGQYTGRFRSTNSDTIIGVSNFTGTVTAYLYLDIASNSSFTSNLSTYTLASAYYNRAYSSGPITSATANLVATTANISVNFSTSGTWYVRLRWNASGYPGQGSWEIKTVTSATDDGATPTPSSILTLSKSVSITEITAGGFQVIRSDQYYVRSSRQGTSTIMLEVGGEIRATGEITAFASTSDRRLKENIIPIDSALDKIGKLNGVEFDWKDEWLEKKGGEDGYLVRRHDVGIIAQEIEEVLPEVVGTRPDGYKAVKYEKIVPLLIESIKEQQKIILNLSASLVETIKKVL